MSKGGDVDGGRYGNAWRSHTSFQSQADEKTGSAEFYKYPGRYAAVSFVKKQLVNSSGHFALKSKGVQTLF